MRSVLRLTQRCPQRVCPVGQAPRQRPLTHIWSPAQEKPQVPQFIGSDPRSRHMLRQGESGASQVRPPMSVVGPASGCGVKRVSVSLHPCAAARRSSVASARGTNEDSLVRMGVFIVGTGSYGDGVKRTVLLAAGAQRNTVSSGQPDTPATPPGASMPTVAELVIAKLR